MSVFSGTGVISSPHPKPGRKQIEAKAPYPIPLSNWDRKADQQHYFWKGNLKNEGVEVHDNIEELYNRGFFGVSNTNKIYPVTINDGENLAAILEKQEIKVDEIISTEPSHEPSEYLILSHEETFFLSYAIPCIRTEENGKAFNLDTLWSRLCDINPKFPQLYAAYHYFRSKGWIVRSGYNFGSNYVLYKDGPSFFHSTYSVRILDGKNFVPNMSWAQLAALNRTTANAGKEVLFCYVFLPEDTSNPQCIPQIEIQEVLLSRWISSEERMKQGNS